MGIGSTKQTYNSQTFEIWLFIYNNDISLSAPELMTNENGSVVPTDEIVYISFENSMSEFVPRAEFEIIDNDNAITNRLKAQNCRIFLSIEKSGRR